MPTLDKDLKLPGRRYAKIYRLTEGDKKDFLEKLAGSHLHSDKIAEQCGFNLDSVNYVVHVEKDELFNLAWNNVMRSRTSDVGKRRRVFNSIAQKGELQQLILDAGINDTMGAFVRSMDVETPAGRREFIKFFEIYQKLFPKESASDVMMRKDVTISDFRDKKPLALRAIVRELQIEVGGMLEEASEADKATAEVARKMIEIEAEGSVE